MTGFSKRPQDVATARRFLIAAAPHSDRRLPTYGDVAHTFGGIARGLGPVLNSIARDCDNAGEPDLSALVVDARTGLAGMFHGRPVGDTAASQASWRNELDRIRRWKW